MGGMVLAGPVVAQEDETDNSIEARLEALENQIQQQQSEYQAQRELLEKTIREQQKNLEAQQRQLTAQYELIQELQGEQAASRPAETVEPRTELAGSPDEITQSPGTKTDNRSEGQSVEQLAGHGEVEHPSGCADQQDTSCQKGQYPGGTSQKRSGHEQEILRRGH